MLVMVHMVLRIVVLLLIVDDHGADSADGDDAAGDIDGNRSGDNCRCHSHYNVYCCCYRCEHNQHEDKYQNPKTPEMWKSKSWKINSIIF